MQGIRVLQRELFSLNDAELAVEILLLRSNLFAWIEKHFELNDKDREAFHLLSPASREFLAVWLSNRFALRKSIHFTVIRS